MDTLKSKKTDVGVIVARFQVNELHTAHMALINSKGYKVLDPHIGIIYGDSLTEDNIMDSLELLKRNGFSAETSVYGCGSYLVRKLHRDTLRFAFKSSAQERNGIWFDVFKKPKDESKESKKGLLKLIIKNEEYKTVNIKDEPEYDDKLELVFLDGDLMRDQDFEEIREIAKTV
jgi:nicotinamide phosphoribosyltransferase